MRSVRNLAAALLSVWCVTGSAVAADVRKKTAALKDAAIESYLDSLSAAQRISQIFLVNISGSDSYTPVESSVDIPHCAKDNNVPLVPGGCLFFTYNIASEAEGLIDFTSSIAQYCERKGLLRPYLAVDQEGGLVNRLRDMTSMLPSNQRVAQALSPSQSYRLYALQARQLRAAGFDMNLAPVTEASSSQNADFLGTRTYGDESTTAAYCIAAVRAYQDNGVGTVVKHFPGNTNTDPHTGLPEIRLPASELERMLLVPFANTLAANPSAVLMSHARTSAYDSNTPACLSSFWIRDMLRGKLGYHGLVLSDDIFMAALAENGFPPEKAAVQAVEAGVDVIMLSEKKFASVAQTLLSYAAARPKFAARLRNAQKNVIAYKIDRGILSLAVLADGTYSVVPVPVESQLGSRGQRLTEFKKVRQEGNDFVRKHFQ